MKTIKYRGRVFTVTMTICDEYGDSLWKIFIDQMVICVGYYDGIHRELCFEVLASPPVEIVKSIEWRPQGDWCVFAKDSRVINIYKVKDWPKRRMDSDLGYVGFYIPKEKYVRQFFPPFDKFCYYAIPIPITCKVRDATPEERLLLSYYEKLTPDERERKDKENQKKRDELMKQVAATIRRDSLVFSPANIPPGPIGDALRALDPDTRQIVNLRQKTDEKGKTLSWPCVAELFRRKGKEGKKYTDERCRQIYAEAVGQHPELKALFSRKRVPIEGKKEKTDAEEIEEMTGHGRARFDMDSLSDDDGNKNPGYRITKSPRKPV